MSGIVHKFICLEKHKISHDHGFDLVGAEPEH